MLHTENENSNAQSWELEITCKNKKYLDAVVAAILKYGMMNFQVESTECFSNVDENGNPSWDGRYLVLIWCSWFDNLAKLSNDLAAIENKFETI